MIKKLSGRVGPIALRVAMLTLPFAPVQAQIETTKKIGISLYEVADLTVESRREFPGTIAVSGILRCSSKQICWFEHPTNPQLHVPIKFSANTLDEKQRLIHNCIASPCGELLIGVFDRLPHNSQFEILR
jgi:hypothetical protein